MVTNTAEYAKQYYKDNKEAATARQNKYYLKYPKRYMLRGAKRRASNKGLEFNLTEDDFELPTHCPILGLKLKQHHGEGKGGRDDSYCLDRVDNTKGYIKGNVAVMSHKANRLKGDSTVDDIRNLLYWMEEYEHGT